MSWSKPQPPTFFGPALGLRQTDVTFPLSRRLALLGRFEGHAMVLRADRRMVATVNYRTAANGERLVCSPREDFPCLSPEGVGTAADLIAAIQKRAAAQTQAEKKRRHS